MEGGGCWVGNLSAGRRSEILINQDQSEHYNVPIIYHVKGDQCDQRP